MIELIITLSLILLGGTLDSGIKLEMVEVSPRRVRSVRLHRPHTAERG